MSDRPPDATLPQISRTPVPFTVEAHLRITCGAVEVSLHLTETGVTVQSALDRIATSAKTELFDFSTLARGPR